MAYQQLLEDPRWQRRRLEIFQRDEWACLRCGRTDITLTCHHRRYRYPLPWDSPDEDLETLCKLCHDKEHVGLDFETLFTLRQRIAEAHARRDWNEVWRLAHVRDFEESV